MICTDKNKVNTLLYLGTSFTQEELLIGHKFGLSIYSTEDGSNISHITKFGGVSVCASTKNHERLAIVGTYEERAPAPAGAAIQSIPDQNVNPHNLGPRTVAIVEAGEITSRIPLPTQVINLRMTDRHLVVVLEYAVEIYALNGKKWELRKHIKTQQNLNGACCVTSDGKYVVVPGEAVGSAEMYSLESFVLKCKTNVGHSHNVAALAVTGDGAFVASGSVESAEARFGMCDGNEIKMNVRFKRGSTSSSFTFLQFSEDGKIFALTSDSSSRTFHFYSTEKSAEGFTNWAESFVKKEARKEIGNFPTNVTGLVVFLPGDNAVDKASEEEKDKKEVDEPKIDEREGGEKKTYKYVIVTEKLEIYFGEIKQDLPFEAPKLIVTLTIN